MTYQPCAYTLHDFRLVCSINQLIMGISDRLWHDAMLNLYKLEIFAYVVEAGSFSRAANRLLLSQSAVSQHIQDLERYLGTSLFDRGPRGVQLTAAGSTLHDYTTRLLALVTDAENAVLNVANSASGQISIGATPGVNIYLLPEWIGVFQQDFPHVTLSLQTQTTSEIINNVLSGDLDVGIVEGEMDQNQPVALGVVVIQQVELYVIIGRGHRCWQRDTAPPDALDGQPFVVRQQGSQTRAWFEQILRQHNIRPRIVAEFDNQESIKHAVASGMGITILPEYAVKREVEAGTLRALPIENLALKRTVKLVWRKTRTPRPVLRAFLTSLSHRFPQLVPIVGEG